MTRKEQNKTLNDKIEANNAQYNLDRMNAEISAYSSGNLSKYEYLTNKDLGYKPDAFEKVKLGYSPLGKVCTDGLDKSDKKEGLLKRLKNFGDKSNNQNQVEKDKKNAKVLKRIINEISLHKIMKKHILKKLLIYHGLIIQNYLVKLVMMLLVDTIKIKIHLNYYLFKVF